MRRERSERLQPVARRQAEKERRDRLHQAGRERRGEQQRKILGDCRCRRPRRYLRRGSLPASLESTQPVDQAQGEGARLEQTGFALRAFEAAAASAVLDIESQVGGTRAPRGAQARGRQQRRLRRRHLRARPRRGGSRAVPGGARVDRREQLRGDRLGGERCVELRRSAKRLVRAHRQSPGRRQVGQAQRMRAGLRKLDARIRAAGGGAEAATVCGRPPAAPSPPRSPPPGSFAPARASPDAGGLAREAPAAAALLEDLRLGKAATGKVGEERLGTRAGDHRSPRPPLAAGLRVRPEISTAREHQRRRRRPDRTALSALGAPAGTRSLRILADRQHRRQELGHPARAVEKVRRPPPARRRGCSGRRERAARPRRCVGRASPGRARARRDRRRRRAATAADRPLPGKSSR